MVKDDIELNIGINGAHLEASIQKVLERIERSPGLKLKTLPKSPFTAYAKEKTKVGKIHLDPLKKLEAPGKSLSIDNLKRLMRLWKIDLIWKWIKGTWSTLLKTNPILDSLMGILNAVFSLISMALLFPFLDDIIDGLKVLLKESVKFFDWMRGFKGLDVSEIPGRIAKGINDFFDNINWGEVGTKIGTTISGVIETIKKTIEEIDWVKIGDAIGTTFTTLLLNVDWIGVGTIIGNAIVAAVKVALGIGKGLWETGLEKGHKMRAEVAIRLGKGTEDVNILDILGISKGGLEYASKHDPILKLLGIEKHAEGGIFTSPTVGMIGEAGPEAVVPLDKMKNMGGTTITVSGLVDEYKFRSIIREEIEKSNRRLYNVRGAVGV